MALELATLLYHEVTDDPSASGFQRASARSFKHRRDVFGAHLDAIAAAGRTPSSASAVDWTRTGRHLLLTFDDGGASALYTADALARRGWIGHFFVTTGKLGTRAFLDGKGVRALRAAGHVVGTHSHSHPNIFRALSPPAMLREWRESRDRLEQLLGERVAAASVPGGDSSRAVERSAVDAGLKWLFTSEPVLAPRRVAGCWVVGRACVKTTTSTDVVRALASFHGWRKSWVLWQLKDVARVAAAPAYRLWVRSRATETP